MYPSFTGILPDASFMSIRFGLIEYDDRIEMHRLQGFHRLGQILIGC